MMYKIILTKDINGLVFNSPMWKDKDSIAISPVTVITGNNGTGKTALLNAIALGSGIDLDFTSLSESKQHGWNYPRDLNIDIEKFGSIKNSYNPVEVFFYSALTHLRGRGIVTNELDLMRCWGNNKSHGEILNQCLNRHFGKSSEYLKANQNTCCMHIFDEIESGASLEKMQYLIGVLGIITKRIIDNANEDRKPNTALIFATQNPELVMELVTNGAMRIDLGGWEHADPFKKYLEIL